MAEVWCARMRGAASFSREVALKIMLPELDTDPAFVTMFVDEAVISAKLKHPNIVGTLDFGRVSDRYFIALELVDGLPLRALLRNARIALEESLHIVAEIAGALDYAYSLAGDDGTPLQLVHRDVNPSNVMITTHGHVKLNDFGIAKAMGSGSTTQAGQLKGKLSYMSPEQAWGRPLDGRSDVYALGLLLYELVVGRRAILGANEIEVLEAARSGVVPAFSEDMPTEVGAICRRALAVAPDDRYPTAGAMRDALAALLAQSSTARIEQTLGGVVATLMRVEREDATPAVGFQPVDTGTLATLRGKQPLEGTEVATGGVLVPSVIGPSPRRARWAVVLVLPVAVIGGWWARRLSTPSSTVAPETIATRVNTEPSDADAAAQPVEGVHAVPTPGRVAPVVSSTHTHHATGPATLRISAHPWAQVSIDGKDVGMTPLRPIEMAAGRHQIIGVNPQLGKRKLVVTLTGGERKRIELEFERGKP